MHVILTGATGTVGAPVLRRLLVTPAITKVSILSRREFPLPQPPSQPPPVEWDPKKADIIVHKDFATYPPDEYIRITNTYPIAAAKAFSTLSPSSTKFNFVHVSGNGADQDESKARALFGKFHVYNVRPGYVDPEGQPTPARSTLKRVAVDGMIGPLLKAFASSLVSPTSKLSKPLTGEGILDGGRTISTVGILRLAEA
ncbi:hypothetical protein DL96DRAFT_1694421 [Flagelloscypha sp. PMI_526]|nr:hypothetical protein DL96DRAFT_1694421 [Flagelloscypha sp. PMI_526]